MTQPPIPAPNDDATLREGLTTWFAARFDIARSYAHRHAVEAIESSPLSPHLDANATLSRRLAEVEAARDETNRRLLASVYRVGKLEGLIEATCSGAAYNPSTRDLRQFGMLSCFRARALAAEALAARVPGLEAALREVRNIAAEADRTPIHWKGRRDAILSLTQRALSPERGSDAERE